MNHNVHNNVIAMLTLSFIVIITVIIMTIIIIKY